MISMLSLLRRMSKNYFGQLWIVVESAMLNAIHSAIVQF